MFSFLNFNLYHSPILICSSLMWELSIIEDIQGHSVNSINFFAIRNPPTGILMELDIYVALSLVSIHAKYFISRQHSYIREIKIPTPPPHEYYLSLFLHSVSFKKLFLSI